MSNRILHLTFLAILAAAPALGTAWLVPLAAGPTMVSCAPDELSHAEYAVALADGDFTVWPDSPWRMSFFPPSQYAAQTAGILAARVGGDAAWQYRLPLQDSRLQGFPLARVGSVLLGVLAVLALAETTRLLTNSARLGLIGGVIAALYPQRFFISGYVNADAFTFCAASLLVLALAGWLRRGEREDGLAALGLAAGAVLLAKPSGFALLPPTALWVAWAWRAGHLRLRSVIATGFLALGVAAPVLAWNAIRIGALDPLGVDAYGKFVQSSMWRGEEGFVLPENAVWMFARALARSSFMKFSNMSLAIPAWLFGLWVVIVAVGSLLAARGLGSASASTRRMAAWLVGTLLLSVGLAVYQSFTIDFSPQGRYILLPIVLLTMVAFLAPEQTGVRHGHLWTGAAIAYLVIVALWSLSLLALSPCGPGIT